MRDGIGDGSPPCLETGYAPRRGKVPGFLPVRGALAPEQGPGSKRPEGDDREEGRHQGRVEGPDLRDPVRGQDGGVVADVADVADQRPATGSQHARDLGDGLGATGGVVDVVDGLGGQDDVEGAVRKRHPPHVPVLTSTRSATPSLRAFSSVASGRLPDRSSACQMSIPTARPVVNRRGGAHEHEPASAAHVEHPFGAGPGDPVEQPLAVPDLAALAGPQHPQRHGRATPARPQRARRWEAQLDARVGRSPTPAARARPRRRPR